VIVVNRLVSDGVAAARARLRWHRGAGPHQRCAVVGFDRTASSLAAVAYAGGWAERNQGGVVLVHVENVPGATLTESTCAIAGVVPLLVPRRDLSADVDEAMAGISAPWAYVSVCGDVAEQLEVIARAVEADVIVVGRSARARMRIAHPVGRRLLATTRHVIVVV
jgi:nucleotide-binding universal stress UspA family protein